MASTPSRLRLCTRVSWLRLGTVSRRSPAEAVRDPEATMTMTTISASKLSRLLNMLILCLPVVSAGVVFSEHQFGCAGSECVVQLKATYLPGEGLFEATTLHLIPSNTCRKSK